MKGILLAGGSGTRMWPLTQAISKQLLPIYDKPMVYYPLSVLMLAGIREVMIISTPHDLPHFKSLLGSGEQIGMQLTYREQPKPDGIAQAYLIAEEWLAGEPSCLILGDNIFYGFGFSGILRRVVERKEGATVFAHYVRDPQRFGVVEMSSDGHALGIEEKPTQPKSNLAVTGLYFYDGHASEYARRLSPSARGELEITDLNKIYLKNKNLFVESLGRGFAWLDTGTHDSLLEASHFVQTIEKQQRYKVACLEEISLRNGWLTREDVQRIIHSSGLKSPYYSYLSELMETDFAIQK